MAERCQHGKPDLSVFMEEFAAVQASTVEQIESGEGFVRLEGGTLDIGVVYFQCGRRAGHRGRHGCSPWRQPYRYWRSWLWRHGIMGAP